MLRLLGALLTEVAEVLYVVLGLLHQDVQPLAEVRGDHMHEAEPRHCHVVPHLHVLQRYDKVELCVRFL